MFLCNFIFYVFLCLNERIKEAYTCHPLCSQDGAQASSPSEVQGPLPLPFQGSVGICRVWATMVEAILSPSAHIASLGGPERWARGKADSGPQNWGLIRYTKEKSPSHSLKGLNIKMGKKKDLLVCYFVSQLSIHVDCKHDL